MNNYICPGCSVRKGHEHRCTKDESDGFNNLTRQMCSCPECRDLDAFTQLSPEEQNEVINGNFKSVQSYLEQKSNDNKREMFIKTFINQ